MAHPSALTLGDATRALWAAIAEHPRGSIPCEGDPTWTSDSLADLRIAARACRGCPVMDLCAAAGELETSCHTEGVWAGRIHHRYLDKTAS